MHLALRIGVALALAACSGTASKPTSSLSPEVPAVEIDPNLAPTGRLGQATIPTGYQLALELDPQFTNFYGEIAIDIDVRVPVDTIWMHSKALQISAARVEQGGRTIALETLANEEGSELLGLRSSTDLAMGPARIHLAWKGRLGTIQGLFRQVENHEWYIYSDFEATDARAAFPCYDDPQFKVPWTVSVQVPSSMLAFSNAPETSRQSLDTGKTVFHFAQTRPLPSYLVAMAAGPFDVIEGKASQTPLRIIAPKGQAEDGRFVLESTGKMLRYLEEYLDSPMPFRKLDFIAVPRFGGAMENPGLITFSSAILLVGKTPSPAAKRRALGVTAHELAHLWFGDLITPDYWNDIWLNEGFATWLSDKAVAIAQPELAGDVLDIADKALAYKIDYRLDGRRVREPIEDRKDIRESFDHITYRKGGAILTMLEGWLGESRMRDAVRSYLKEADGKTVVTEGLIASMVNSTGVREVAPFLTSFLTQTGIPQVHARVHCQGPPELTLRQSRYLPLEALPKRGGQDRVRRWHLPVCVRYPGAGPDGTTVRQCIELAGPSATMRLQTATCPAWILPNDGDSGYYHYLLSPEGYANVPLDRLSIRETVGLVHSISAAMHAGDLNIEQGLALLKPTLAVKSSKVHEVVHDVLYYLANSVVGEQERPAFAALVRRWYQPVVGQMGIRPRAHDEAWETEIRPPLMLLLADLGEDTALRDAVRRQVDSWLDDPVEMDSLVLDSWLQIAALGGDEVLARNYKKTLRNTKDRVVRFLLYGALHGFRNPELFADALEATSQLSPAAWPILAQAMRYPTLRKRLFETLQLGKVPLKESMPLFAPMCDNDAVARIEAFVGNEKEARALLDPIEGCIAFARVQQASATAHFSEQR